MAFNSINFIYFLILVFSSYWALPKLAPLNKINSIFLRNSILLISSYIFYGWINKWFCFLILTSTLIDYFCGRIICHSESRKTRKIFLIISILANLSILGFFKYFNFFAENFYILIETMGFRSPEIFTEIILPVGISFYTFQSMSYSIDIYRGNLKAEKNFILFAVYISFFPQLVAGPIERAKNILPQLKKTKILTMNNFYEAFPLILSGYLKKLVIADNLGIYVDKVFAFNNPDFFSITSATIAFSFQIYADFSAYTDIARGVAKLFGIDLMKNFNSPFLAVSPSDFWRRWHISFSTWIRDYVFIPLGGSKVNTIIKLLGVFLITFTLSGLWHGASWNFLLWGVFHGIVIWVYHILGFSGNWQPRSKISKYINIIFIYSLFLAGWALFRTDNIFWLMEGVTNFNINHIDLFIPIYGLIYSIFYSSFFLVVKLSENTNKQLVRHACYLIMLVSLVFLSVNVEKEFIYFQF